MKKLIITFLIATTSMLAIAQSASWVAQTSNTTNNLKSIDFPDANTGFAVGESGRIVKTSDGGTTWTATTAGANHFYSTSFVNTTTGWVVGLSGTIYKTADAFASVISQTSGTSLRLNAIKMSSATTGWIAGNVGTILKTTTGGISWANKTGITSNDLYATFIINDNTVWFSGYGGTLIRTLDGGTTFSAVTSGTTSVLYSIFFADANTGWAVGSGGVIIKTTDGGTTWSAQSSGLTSDLYSVRFADANRGWAVGANGNMLYTMNGGTNWVAQTSLSTTNLYAVCFKEGYSTGWVAGNAGAIYKTTSSGNEWITQQSGTTSNLYDVDFYSTTSGITVGTAGVMYKTTNSGSTWTALTSGTTNNINGIECVNSTLQIAVGAAGTILKSTNATTWTPKTSGTTYNLQTVKFYDVNNGLAAGSSGTILRTTDGGNTWVSHSLSTTYSIGTLYYTSSTTVYAIGTYTVSLHVVDGVVLKSTDGGSTWTEKYTHSNSLYSGYFYGNMGWVAGAGGFIVKTVDGGATWNTQTSGIGDYIYYLGYAGATTTTLWALGSSGSIIKTTNGGTTWTKQSSGTRNNILGALFASTTQGYAVGDAGTIIKMHDASAVESAPTPTATTFCRGNTILATNSISGTFYNDNVFYLQLSNSSGTFSSPATIIGSAATTIGGSISGTIPSDATNGSAYKIRVVSTDPYIIGSACSSNITIAVPTSSISPAGNVSTCQGSSLTLTANSGVSGLTCQWKKDGVNISGATGTSYSATVSGSYTVLSINSSGCSLLSSPTTVTVYSLPSATITPSGATTFCSGGTVVLTANTGTGYTYVWKRDDVAISGATSQSYTVNESGTYTVVVTNTYGCLATSTGTVVVVNNNPTADISPSSSVSLCTGSSQILTATAGTGNTYVWKKNGTAISGATSQTYTATTTGSYSVMITNSTGCSSSSFTETVTFNPLPVATATAEGPTSFCSGGSVNLTAAYGSGYLYQWEKDDNTIDGATNITYAATESGNYSFFVSDANGCSASFYSIYVTVNSYPTATFSASGPTTFCEGNTVNFTANNGAGYTYQWTKNNTVVSTATASTYTVNQAGVYRVIVTNTNGCATTSNASSVVVNALPMATIAPASATTFCAGGSVVLNANTDSGLTYIWEKDLINISGATSDQYIASQTGSYTLLVYNGNCTNTSGAIHVVSYANPVSNISYSGSNSICEGASLSLTANVDTSLVDGFESGDLYKNPYAMSGNLPWKVAPAIAYMGSYSAKSGNILDNQTSEMSLTINLAYADTILFYRKVASEANYDYLRFYIDGFEVGSWSGTVEWTRTAFAVGQGSHTFKWAYTKDGSSSILPDCAWIDNIDLKYNSNILYQWKNNDNAIFGATNSTYVATTSGNYTVGVTNTNGCITNSAITSLTVNPLPDATVTAATPTSFCQGGAVTLFVNNVTNQVYQWMQEGINISGATNSAYIASAGGNYSVAISDMTSACSSISTNNPVSVYPLPTVDAGSDVSVFNGASTTLSVSASGGSSPYSYSWTPIALLLNPASNSTSTLNMSSTTVFSVTATDSLGCTGSDNVVVSVTGGALSASASTSANSICNGNSTTLIAGASGGSGTYTYSWTSTDGFSSATANPIVSPTVTTTYSVAVNDGTNGATSSVIINVNALPTATITPSGPTTFCNGNSVTIAAPDNALYSYVWKKDGNIIDGATTSSYIATLDGNYRVYITDAQGCDKISAVTTVVVNNLPNADVSSSAATTFCEGESIFLSTASMASHSYQWYNNSNPINGATFYQYQASTSGSYTLRVTGNITGCSHTSTPIIVTSNSLPTISIVSSGNTSFCDGNTVEMMATTNASSIYWLKNDLQINGATISSYAASTTGQYKVYVQDANGCFNYSNAIDVVINPLPSAVITPSGSTVFCDGESVILSTDFGSNNQYQWALNGVTINGANAYQYTASQSGFYTVSITDTNACAQISLAEEIKINYPPLATVTVTGNTTFCSGDSALLSGPVGTGYLYQWNKNYLTFSGGNSSSVYASQSGIYTLILQDSNACTTTSSPIDITANALPEVLLSHSGNISICEGQSFELSTTAALGQTYQWYKDGNIIDAANLSSYYPTETAQYTVAVTSAAGCNGISALPASITVNSLPQVSILYQGNTSICSGSSLLLKSSAAFASYLWLKNGVFVSSNDSLYATEEGLYTLTVNDTLSCSATSLPVTISINPNPIAQITLSSSLTFCQGDSVTISVNDEPGYQYQWKKDSTPIQNANTPNYTATTAGLYTVEITNSNGCIYESNSYQVIVNSKPSASISLQGSSSICSGASTLLTALPSGNYQYLWLQDGNTFNGNQSSSINASLSGLYSVIITDSLGCSETSDALALTIKPLPPTTLTYFGSNNFCQGDSLIISAAVGLNYTYLWMNQDTVIDTTFANTHAVFYSGNYSVLIYDTLNGCHSTSSNVTANMGQLPSATIIPIGNSTVCEGSTVQLIVSTESGNTYQWYLNDSAMSGSTSLIIYASQSGSYTLKATNSQGCSYTSAAEVVKINAKPIVNAGLDKTISNGASTTLAGSATSGTLPYTYSWTPIGLISSGANTNAPSTINLTSTNSFTLSVSDSAGCSNSDEMTVYVTGGSLSVNILPSANSICQGDSVSLTSTPTGGSGTFTYSWSSSPSGFTSSLSNPTVSPTVTTTYTITVNDGFYTANTSVVVNVNSNPNATVTPVGNTSVCSGSSVQLNANTGAGYTYQWTKNGSLIQGVSSSSYAAVETGSYAAIITNTNGCSSTSNVTSIVVNTLPDIFVSTAGSTTFCQGEHIVLQVSSSMNVTYQWKKNGLVLVGETTDSLSVSQQGNYTVLATSNQGCTNTSANLTVIVNAKPSAQITVSGNTTFCEGGTTTLLVGTGSDLSYQWNLDNILIYGATNSSLIASASGMYSVVVTNINGCTELSNQVEIISLAKPLANAGSDISISNGSTTTLTGSVSGGSGTYSVLWTPTLMLSTGENTLTPTTTNLSSSTIFTLTVIDSTGCESSDEVGVYVIGGALSIQLTAATNAICSGSSVQLNALTSGGSGNNSFTWSSVPSGFSDNTSQPIVSPIQTTTYTVEVSDGASTITNAIVISVDTLPSAVITPASSTTICSGSQVLLNANMGNGLSYQWKKDNVAISGANTSSYQASASGLYSVVISTTGGCFSESVQETVIVYPVTLAEISTSSSSVFCFGNDVVLNANIGSGLSYQWEKNNVAIAGAIGSSYTAVVGGNYSVIVYNEYGCSSTSSPLTVTAIQPPSAIITVAGGNSTICQGDSVTMLVGTGNGYIYQWKKDGFDILGFTTPSVNASIGGIYTVIVTDTVAGCFAESNAVSIITKPTPDATITQIGNSIICDGDTVTLKAVTNIDYYYQWKKDGFDIANEIADNLLVMESGNYQLSLIDTTNSCASISLPKLITVNQNPIPTIVQTGSLTLCTNNIVTLSTGLSYSSYNWSNGQSIDTTNVTSAALYSVSVTDINGCHGVAADSVKAYTIPATEICMVTVDSATSSYNVVVWEKPITSLIDSFIVYREFAGNVFERIASVSYDSLGMYKDFGANPTIHQWRYKLSAKDTCGNETPLSNAHATMFLQFWIGASNETSLDWSFYEGYYFPYYYIYKGSTLQTLALYDSVASTSHGYNDFNITDAYYRVFFSNPNNCNANKVGVEDGFFSSSISNLEQRLVNKINPVSMETEISLSPNPANDNITIVLSRAVKSEITILSLDGQKIRTVKMYEKSNAITIDDLARGVYFVKVKTDNLLKTIKLVKN